MAGELRPKDDWFSFAPEWDVESRSFPPLRQKNGAKTGTESMRFVWLFAILFGDRD